MRFETGIKRAGIEVELENKCNWKANETGRQVKRVCEKD